ncbi:MAG: hypothetical protein HKL88_03845 [Bacteroidia bacterium]|jgi:cardiolipin synthase|nr:hypothetical protein [Bacteroidia bacterium]
MLQADKLELVFSGEDYFSRTLDIIGRSTRQIRLNTYIFTDDATGAMVIKALKDAVARGVNVYVLVDAFGSMSLGSHAIKQIEEAGINFRKFSPLFVNHHLRFGRRLHHKILAGDDKEALIGGINIEDKYRVQGDKTPWLDYAVYVSGPVCHYITYLCGHFWEGKILRIRPRIRQSYYRKPPISGSTGGIDVKILQNDWLYKREDISRKYRHVVMQAQSSIVILGSYFLPGRRIRNLLRKAAARNVRVQLILQGASDVALVQKATTWLYGWMLRNNFEIYEWEKTILHGKMTCIDNNWATVGSYNVNHLSDYGSIETNVASHNPDFCASVKKELQRVMDHSVRITYPQYHQRMNPFQQFTCWMSFHIMRILFKLQIALLSRE